MTAPWEQPGLTPKQRARRVCGQFFTAYPAESAIAEEIAAAVAEEREACALLLLREAGACQIEAEALGIDTEPAIRRGIIRDSLRGMAADIRTRTDAKEGT